MDNRHLPPQSIEAEMSVLGAVFVDNRTIDEAQEVLSCEDFYRQTHRIIFQKMVELADKSTPIDLVTLTDELKKSDNLEEVGGGAYLCTLVDYVPTSANIKYYCRIVKERSTLRKLLLGAQEVQQMIYDDKPVVDIISHMEKSTMPAQEGNEPESATDVLRRSIKQVEKRYENKGQVMGIPYGIPELDELTNGMHGGQLIIVAGRPSMGKSAFAGNICESACINGKSAAVWTMEMQDTDYMDRLLSAKGQVRYQNIRSGRLQETEWPRMNNAASAIAKWSLFLTDTPGVSFPSIRSKARRLKKSADLGLVVVDYLQLMTLPKNESYVRALGEVTRGFKELARELDIPVVLLSQLNRGVDSRPEKRPMMSDLRDSGEIEQDADVILFPYRPSVYCKDCKDKISDGSHDYEAHQYQGEIIIGKQRNGPAPEIVRVAWAGDYQKFRGLNGKP